MYNRNGLKGEGKAFCLKMIPPSFEYSCPTSLQEAVSQLQKFGADSKILAGGQSLIPVLKLRLGSPSHLIDINRISGLEYINESDGVLKLGALTRISDIEDSELIRKQCQVLHDAASHIADPTVRNLGTIGGNVSHADPANDLPAVILATEAEMKALGPSGITTFRADEFFVDTFTTSLEHDKILTEIRIPLISERSGGAYLKLEKRSGDFAIVGVAAQVTLDSKGNFDRVGLGLTAVSNTAVKPRRAEETLTGRKSDDLQSIKKSAELASDSSKPVSDLRGPAEYKKEMVKVLTFRAIKLAVDRALNPGGA